MYEMPPSLLNRDLWHLVIRFDSMPFIDSLLLDPHRINIWIARRTDEIKGSGTLSDPFDASTADRFDALMNSLTEFTRVHLGPGVFETRGYSDAAPGAGWQPKHGMKITGSGIDLTTLKLVGAGEEDAQYFAVGHILRGPSAYGAHVHSFEISDLTIDCNLTAQVEPVACGAVRIKGTHSRIRRVKTINWGTTTTETPCYVFAAITVEAGSIQDQIHDSVIDQCIAIEPNNDTDEDGVIVVLHVGGPAASGLAGQPVGESAVIRNCFVDGAFLVNGELVPDLTKDIRALSTTWCHGVVLERNQIRNVRYGGPCHLQGSGLEAILRLIPEAIVRDNLYHNVFKGPYLDLGDLLSGAATVITNITVTGNTARVTMTGSHQFNAGHRVKISGTTAFDGEVRVLAIPTDANGFPELNKFDFETTVSGSASSGSAYRIIGVDKLLFEGNTIELALPTQDDPVPIGIHVDDAGASTFHPHDQIIIRGNVFRYFDGASGTLDGCAIDVSGARNAIISDNIVGTVPSTGDAIRTANCEHATFFDNRTTLGNGFAGDKYTEELDVPSEEPLLLACFEK
jgi:hypothetical protein